MVINRATKPTFAENCYWTVRYSWLQLVW